MRCLHLIILVPLIFCVGLVEARERRQIEEIIEVEAGKTVRIDLSVAELAIEATDRTDVAVDLSVHCRWSFNDCDDALEDLELNVRQTSRRLTLELTGISHWRSSMIGVEGTIQVPRTSPVEVKMGVAELEISGVEQDLRVDIGVGDLDIRLPEAKIAEAFVDVGVGQIRFVGGGEHLDGQRSFFVGNEVHWSEGAGQAEVDIEVGVGEVKVRLEQAPPSVD